ncbi:IS66 family transposase [bacterium]|nr:IS66 family transposase [bacterium]
MKSAHSLMHTRRFYHAVLNSDPQTASDALDMIVGLYQHDALIIHREVVAHQKQQYRVRNSEPVLEYIYAWVEAQRQREDLLPQY